MFYCRFEFPRWKRPGATDFHLQVVLRCLFFSVYLCTSNAHVSCIKRQSGMCRSAIKGRFVNKTKLRLCQAPPTRQGSELSNDRVRAAPTGSAARGSGSAGGCRPRCAPQLHVLLETCAGPTTLSQSACQTMANFNIILNIPSWAAEYPSSAKDGKIVL